MLVRLSRILVHGLFRTCTTVALCTGRLLTPNFWSHSPLVQLLPGRSDPRLAFKRRKSALENEQQSGTETEGCETLRCHKLDQLAARTASQLAVQVHGHLE